MPEWIQQHPVLSAIIAGVVFFLWRLPEWLGQVWPLFTDKKLPEWFAERRWPGMSTVLYRWFNVATTVAVFVLLGIIIYQQQGEDSKRESPVASTSIAPPSRPTPAVPPAPTVPSAPITDDQVKDREMGSRRTNQKFSSLLRDFPANNSSSALSQLVVSSKKVSIRANKSSYAQAKVFGKWFREAQWEVVEISDALTEKFPSGITIRAPYNNGDAENVHIALCKLGYRVRRELPPQTFSIAPPPLDFITIEIGDLFS